MNNDGLIDIVVGDRSGKVFFFSRNEDGTLHAEGAFEGIAVNFNSAPTVADWNGDGLLDILTGMQGIYPTYGWVNYHINNGTKENPSFTGGGGTILDENNGWIYHYRCQPQVFDLDEDGTQELIIGEADGNFYFHENIGTNAKPVITQGTSLGIQMDSDCRLSFTDWNEDGVTDIVAGDYGKNVHLFLGNGGTVYNKNVTSTKSLNKTITYNVTKNSITFNLQNGHIKLDKIELLNCKGQKISKFKLTENKYSKTLRFNNGLTKGIYFLKLKAHNLVINKRITIN